MLTLENVYKSYTKNIPVLKNINLHIKQGEMVFIVGLSGAGKTTLMKLITREEKQSSGTIKMLDTLSNQRVDIETIKPHIYRRQIGIVFQDYKLILTKSVFDNIAYPLQVFGESTRDIKKRVEEVAQTVGIEYLLHKHPNELSGGEKQRVGIARALVNNPAILLADEPTGNLDYKTTEDIMRLLSAINRSGTTVIMVTHDTNAVSKCHGRILQVHDGEIIQDLVK